MGIKPVNGGRPARDNIISGVMAVRMAFLVQAVANALRVFDFSIIKMVKSEMLVVIYRVRARVVREGLNSSTRIIQPMCAIEEYPRSFRT